MQSCQIGGYVALDWTLDAFLTDCKIQQNNLWSYSLIVNVFLTHKLLSKNHYDELLNTKMRKRLNNFSPPKEETKWLPEKSMDAKKEQIRQKNLW